jgi:hypothetical protein
MRYWQKCMFWNIWIIIKWKISSRTTTCISNFLSVWWILNELQWSAGLIYSSFFFLIRIMWGGIQSGSTRHVGRWMAYCTCPGWIWWWRIGWNEEWQEKPKYSEKTCPNATLSTTNPTWPGPGSDLAAAVGSQRLTTWAMARPNLQCSGVQLTFQQ